MLAGNLPVLDKPAAARPEALLAEYAAWLAERTGRHHSLPALCRALGRLGVRRKKSSPKGQGQARADVQAERTTWRAEQSAWPVADLIFLDESGIDTAMTRRYARARSGRRAIGQVPAAIGAALRFRERWGRTGWRR